jgi:serine protease Do
VDASVGRFATDANNPIQEQSMNTTTRSMTPTRLVLALAAAGVLGGASATLLSANHARAEAPAAVAQGVLGGHGPMAAATSAVGGPDFSQITARNGAAVVNISVSGIQHAANDEGEAPAAQQRGPQGFDPNDPFFEFFRRFQGPNGGLSGPRDVPVRGQGSGFIVSADGLILTNAHVVRDAKDVTVKLTDRREFKAKVLGSDPKTDVAVLKIDASKLPVVPLGSSRDLKVGEWVLAIGSPFGFENSVSAGVVSAKGRSLPDDSFVPFIQTDVAVNPGNSGGPLFNSRGEVVGINSQIYSRTGGYQGLSFAIPIDLATKIKDQIVATGKASHARLGVAIQEVNQALADSFKLDKPEGALVSTVEPGGPADQAGLKTGDVIRQVNGQAIVAAGDLPALIGQAAPGQKVNIEVWRQGQRAQMTATLADAGDKKALVAKTDEALGKGKLGLALRPLQPEERRDAGVAGLLIEGAGGAAAMAGVQPGDLLMAVNGTPVTSIDQVRQVVAKADKSVALLIQRDGNRIFVPVRIG